MIAQPIAAIDAAERADLGRPSARKSGRSVRWPWVPLVIHAAIHGDERQEQVLRFAFATRQEAWDFAEQTIADRRLDLRRKLADPRYRALRQQHGLPRELSDVEAVAG